MEFTQKEKKVIRMCDTPEKIQRLLLSMPYTYEDDRFRSFRTVIKENTLDCVEGAIAAAAIMSEYGYPALVLDLVAKNDCDHVVFIYRKGGKYGSVAISRDPNLYGRKPVFPSVRELAESYYYQYFADGGFLHSFAVANLDDSGIDWRFSGRDIFELESFFASIRHARVKKSLEHFAVRKSLQAFYLAKRGIKKRINNNAI